MIEYRDNGRLYHDHTSPAVHAVREAVTKTRAPLKIWNNWKLEDQIVHERERIQLITASSQGAETMTTSSSVGPELVMLNSIDSELTILDQKRQQLIEAKQTILQGYEERLKKSVEFQRLKEKLERTKVLETKTKLELQQHEAELKQIQTKVSQTKDNLKTIQDEIVEHTQSLQRVNNDIAENDKVISQWNDILESDSKRLKEDRDVFKRKATSSEQNNESTKKNTHLQVTCPISNERPKNKGTQCGHRFCDDRLDE